ncbi:MAG TPA: PucR family transcriptional regulator ligand-binding domain-containing protein [Candidatus Limnocylindrales bacterium]|nr:PucR family transcriptional regulator ligand-binding domain-containing protein [Candidatus Limnocylindrales bacterium]
MIGGVPLREVLALAPLDGARVVAGATGLDRRVRHVNVMEVPDILPWVEADELLLTTAYPLRDDRAALDELVPGLAGRGLAGLALKPARYIDRIPDEMLAAADRLGFPLIELPPDSSFNDIINSVLTVILNAQASRLQRTAAIHERFTAIVLGGGGLRQIAEALAESIARPVAIVDAAGVIQTGSTGSEAVGRAGRALPLPGPDDDGGDGHDDGHPIGIRAGERALTVQPIRVGSERFGALVLLGEAGTLGEGDVEAIEYAATVAALRQVQARAVAESDRRFQAICLEELVTGHVDRAVLAERAVAFSWDLSVSRAVVIARLEAIGDRPFAQVAGTADETSARRRLAEAARGALGRNAIIWERSAEVAALAPTGPREADLRDLGARLLDEARRTVPDGLVGIGIGRSVADPLALAESWTEARRALEIGRWGNGAGGATVYADLGVDRLLVGLPEADLAEFATSLLAPLVAYDERHRTDLVGTLEVFLETRNAALAARRLFVHYNTLKNRLRLIEELVGPVSTDPGRALGLGVALRVRRLPRA